MPTPEAMYDEAIELQQAGQVEEAVQKLHELVKEHPEYALAHAGLSAFYSKLERHEEAVQHAEKVCELEPDDPFNYMAKSLVSQKAGDTTVAEQAMAQAMEKQWAARRESS